MIDLSGRIRFILIFFFLYASEIFSQIPVNALDLSKDLQLDIPKHGFISAHKADKWEESLLTGNGTIGALIRGNPGDEVIILSHEKLFMPEYPPTDAPDIKKYLGKIRQLILAGEGEKAAELAVQAGVEAGIDDVIWTDPLVPACQMEIQSDTGEAVSAYAKILNYENGEAIIAWQTATGIYQQKMFVSRPAKIAALNLTSPTGAKLNFRFRLAQLPLPEEEEDEEQGFNVDKLVSGVKSGISENCLTYMTHYKKQWPGSLKGYNVTAEVLPSGGSIQETDGWLSVRGADEITALITIKLFFDSPVVDEPVRSGAEPDYERLLAAHEIVHSEMFNRFSLALNTGQKPVYLAEELLASSQPGQLNTLLVQQLCEASRYILISSTGELPPTLQGIWGGTWRPAWSSDFTLNGNVPSAIACGLNGNFTEVTEAYLNYMWSMFDDFEDNARDVYNVDGVWVLSRCSDSGKTYHYLVEYPHMFWYAGSAWTAQFFYDYWLYTGDEKFLRKRTVPFMKAALAFYKNIVTRDNKGKIMFIPSYSPEIAPLGFYPAAINATMDIAALNQLLRNLTTLADQGWVDKENISDWQRMLNDLPSYEIDSTGDLKEWLWPDYENNNQHRHASHLYPLFYEIDPAFIENPALQKAAIQAIEKRMQYRRNKNGAEMAFGLVQLGLAAAHLKDIKHAFECVDWLCNSYWSPAFTSYHNPGEIFNVDICGGLPAVVIEMLVQSSPHSIELLPAQPEVWHSGSITGVLTRCGVTIDLAWKDGSPMEAKLFATRNAKFKIKFKDREWPVEMNKDQSYIWKYSQ